MTVLRAREAFACSDAQGTPRVVRPGDLFDSTDPMVTGRETLFEPVEVATQRSEAVVAGGSSSVESATSAPGEKRSVSTGRGRKSPKDSTDAAPTEQKSAEATTKSTTTGGVGSTPGASDSK